MSEKPLETYSVEARPADIPFATTSLDAPVFYVEDIRGAMVTEGNCKLNLVEYRMDALQQELRAVHVATLVLPANKVAGWGRFLLRLVGEEAEAPPEGPAEAQPEDPNAAP